MSLELKITTALKEAMKSKNQTTLTALGYKKKMFQNL